MSSNSELDLNYNSDDEKLPNITVVFELLPYVDDMKNWQLVVNDFPQFTPKPIVEKSTSSSLEPTKDNNETIDILKVLKQEEVDIKEEFNGIKINEKSNTSSTLELISQASLHNENQTKSDQMLECAQCGYKTSSKATLKVHVKIHLRVKPFACDICDYRTVDKSNLRAHLRIHSGERPHNCTFCTYKTTSKFALKQHITIHTGEKLFKCELCNFRSGFRTSIALHMSTHTRIKPFCCTECNFRSTTRKDLVEHVRVHTGERPFSCSKCEYKASRRGSLKRHEKRRHMG